MADLDPSEHETVEWIVPGHAPSAPDVIEVHQTNWRRQWWFWLVALAVAIAAAVALAAGPGQHAKTAESPSPRRATNALTPLPPPVPSATLISTPTAAASVVTTVVGHPLLDVPANWELFGHGSGFVERIQLRSGRITTTQTTDPESGGPVALVAGPDRVLVQPLDGITAYVIKDGEPAVELPLFFEAGAAAIPAPDRQHVWVQDEADPFSAHLVDLTGKPTATKITVARATGSPGADGAGYLLFPTVDGLYDARPGSLFRVTTGSPLAIGPSGWLAIECDDQLRCTLNVIDRATRSHRKLAADVDRYRPSGGGVISPDGKTAALIGGGDDPTSTVHLLDLTSGADVDTKVSVDVDSGDVDGAFSWSPDSRWVFLADGVGRPVAIERASHHSQLISVPDGPITQVVLRVD